MLRTIGTDVEVIALSVAVAAESEFLIAYEAAKHFRHLAIHKIAYSLKPSKSRGLLFLQMFAGSDQILAFANKKKTALGNLVVLWGNLNLFLIRSVK